MPKKKNYKVDSDTKMKIFVLLALLIAFVGGYFIARAKYKPQIVELSKMVTEKDAALQQMKSNYNKVMMQDGKMTVIENGVASPMDADIMLQNGDKVTTDGDVIAADGTTTKLQNGDAVDMMGKMMPANSGSNSAGF